MTKKKKVKQKKRGVMYYANIMVANAKTSNKEALKAVEDGCPEDLKEKVFAEAIFACAKIRGEALNLVRDSCPDKLKKTVFANALGLCGKDNNEEVFDIIDGACPDDIKLEVLALANSITSQERNEKELKTTTGSMADGLKKMSDPINKGERMVESKNNSSKLSDDSKQIRKPKFHH